MRSLGRNSEIYLGIVSRMKNNIVASSRHLVQKPF